VYPSAEAGNKIRASELVWRMRSAAGQHPWRPLFSPDKYPQENDFEALVENPLMDLDFTGERVVPGKVEMALWAEHVVRYFLAARWVKGKRVLDFGCGVGYGAEFLKAAGAQQIIGLDIAFDAIRYAQTHDPSQHSRLLVADCQKAALRSASFDVVVSFEVIEHVPSYGDYLREARRLLAPGGILLLSTPNKRIYTDESESGKNPFHFKEFYYDELRDTLEEHFPTVVIFGQSTCEGPFFANLSRQEPGGPTELLKHFGAKEVGQEPERTRADFFTALCSVEPEAPQLRDLPNYFSLGPPDELAKAKVTLVRLQMDFDERTTWAHGLDQQLGEREQRRAQLQSEFEERTEWALQLDAKRAELQDLITELYAQLGENNTTIESLRAEIARRDLLPQD
jgi:SAM-dependent methyltransferase